MSYTSYRYIVLGCVMESASGASYTTYMHQSIFAPTAMTSTALVVFAIISHRAHGIQHPQGRQTPKRTLLDISNKPPGIGISSTARDMGLFVVALYAGKLVRPASWTDDERGKGARRQAHDLRMRLVVGESISSYHGLREVRHGGDVQRFLSYSMQYRRRSSLSSS